MEILDFSDFLLACILKYFEIVHLIYNVSAVTSPIFSLFRLRAFALAMWVVA